MWLAYINLENKFGNENALSFLITRAATYNDPEQISTRFYIVFKAFLTILYIYLQIILILTQESKPRYNLAQELLSTITHKYSQNAELWKCNLFFWLTRAARATTNTEKQTFLKQYHDTLTRALSILPHKSHIPLLSALACQYVALSYLLFSINRTQAIQNGTNTIGKRNV